MKSVLLVVGLASVCLLHAEDPIPVQPNFYFKKVAGKWYPIATTKVIPPERMVYAYTMQPLSNGDLVLKIDVPREETCRRKRVVLHTLRRGVFATAEHITFGSTYTKIGTIQRRLAWPLRKDDTQLLVCCDSVSKDDKTTVYLVETDYDTFHIILFTKEGERDLFLYAREEEVSDEVKEKFKNRACELSLDPEAIIYLPKTSPCPETDS